MTNATIQPENQRLEILKRVLTSVVSEDLSTSENEVVIFRDEEGKRGAITANNSALHRVFLKLKSEKQAMLENRMVFLDWNNNVDPGPDKPDWTQFSKGK